MSSAVKRVHDSLLQKLNFFSHKNTLWVAYSGGVDSHVLLHALRELRAQFQFNLQAVHVNHQLQAEAQEWEAHCRAVCADLELPLVVKRLEINRQKGESLEEKARILRLAVFKELLSSPLHTVVTAHHKDDQVETVFSRILRGCGWTGLSGMRDRIPLGKGFLFKPLLEITREEIVRYATEAQLHWVSDSSNRDTRFDRNFLRHQVFPLIRKRWPGFTHPLLRLAEFSRETDELVNEIAEQDLRRVKGETANTLSITQLKQLSPVRQKNCVRFWLKKLEFPVPSYKKLQAVLSGVLLSKPDAIPEVKWSGVVICRYRDHLYVLPPQTFHDVTQVIPWNLKSSIEIPSLSRRIQASELSERLYAAFQASEDPITIRFRQGGEWCKPVGSPTRRSLKNIFQEKGIPPWKRGRIPLIYVGSTLAAVLGVCECEGGD